jgi:hypothetical protein
MQNESSVVNLLSVNEFPSLDNKSLFVSSEVCDKNPYVHHLYLRDDLFHYLVYDPCDDIVIEHISADSLPYTLFLSNPNASFNFFDSIAYELIAPLSKAKCSYYNLTVNDYEDYLTKTLEDVALIMNASQTLSAGYLVTIEYLGNSLAADSINESLQIISAAASSALQEVEFGESKSLHKLHIKHQNAIDEVILAIRNGMPLSLEKIKDFKRAILSKSILTTLLENESFIQIGGVDCMDLLLGGYKFSQDPLFLTAQVRPPKIC